MESARVKRLISKWSGKALNEWTVGEYINGGKSALVFKATKGAIGGAIKIFDPEIVERFGENDEKERIQRELALVGVHHENLIRILDGEVVPKAVSDYFSKIGRRGGLKGGQARAATLSASERSESARKAVLARWAKRRDAG